MAEQERSGPTPAQVEALARVKMKRWGYSPETFAYSALIPHALNEAASDLAAIEAGEVPGVFTADGEQWGVVWPDGGFVACDSEDHARRAVERYADSPYQPRIAFRVLGPWMPVGEEQDHG